jgi:hypothetical protein
MNIHSAAKYAVTVIISSLGGAIFTWYMNRPESTSVLSEVNATTFGTDSTVKGFIPNLKIQIGDEEVPIVQMDTIKLHVTKGPFVDSADVAVVFPHKVRLFGPISAEAPSPVHHIFCQALDTGALCTVRPLKPGSDYTINMATDQSRPPTVVTATKNVELSNTIWSDTGGPWNVACQEKERTAGSPANSSKGRDGMRRSTIEIGSLHDDRQSEGPLVCAQHHRPIRTLLPLPSRSQRGASDERDGLQLIKKSLTGIGLDAGSRHVHDSTMSITNGQAIITDKT